MSEPMSDERLADLRRRLREITEAKELFDEIQRLREKLDKDREAMQMVIEWACFPGSPVCVCDSDSEKVVHTAVRVRLEASDG